MAVVPKILAMNFLVYCVLVCSAIAGENFLEKINDQKVYWEFFTDGVMGGRSEGKAELIKEGVHTFIRMRGEVTTENNGGFIQIRAKVSGFPRKTNGISIKVRGNDEKYYIFLRTNGTVMPWQYYSAEFSTSASWKIVNIDLKNFKRSSNWLRKTIDGTTIKSIGIVAYGRKHSALVEVSEVDIY